MRKAITISAIRCRTMPRIEKARLLPLSNACTTVIRRR
jgi:hypothetical protein